MEKKEFAFMGKVVNGFLMLFVLLALLIASAVLVVINCDCSNALQISVVVLGSLIFLGALFCMTGFMMLEPNTARVMMFFGKYRGTFTKTGFFWVNPFYSTKNLSLRARNLDAEPIKVNDKSGNPVLIG